MNNCTLYYTIMMFYVVFYDRGLKGEREGKLID